MHEVLEPFQHNIWTFSIDFSVNFIAVEFTILNSSEVPQSTTWANVA